MAAPVVAPAQVAAGPLSLPPAIPFAVALAAIHVLAAHVTFADGVPRRGLLSVAGGASVSYVFVHVLPEIGRAARTIGGSGMALAAVEKHAYLIALLGFVAYYGTERFVRCSRDRPVSDDPIPGVFWLHLASFAAYNVLIGYLLVHREEPGLTSLALFAFAMGLHFLVNDYGMRVHYPRRYHDGGRWILAAAVLVGTASGLLTDVDRALTSALFAFLAGGVVLNVIKEELPEERESHFWAFAGGAAGYAVLLMVV